jgi:PAS domain S-box-containing protein
MLIMREAAVLQSNEEVGAGSESDIPADIDAFELAAGGMVVTDCTGRFRRVNPAFAELLGRSRADLVGAQFSSLTSPDDLAQSDAVMRDLLAKKTSTARFEKRYFRPDGSLVSVELNIRSLTGPGGEVVALLVQFLDITERKRAQEAAAIDRWRFEEAERVAGMGSFEWDRRRVPCASRTSWAGCWPCPTWALTA